MLRLTDTWWQLRMELLRLSVLAKLTERKRGQRGLCMMVFVELGCSGRGSNGADGFPTSCYGSMSWLMEIRSAQII